jgi:superfamily II DNA or RNA helicase
MRVGHVYNSWKNAPDKASERQGRDVHRRVFAEYESTEVFVLFNVRLLEEGHDFHHCDAVVSVCVPQSMRSLLQRWGRALRYDPRKPDKEGYLVLVTQDPEDYFRVDAAKQAMLGVNADKVFDRKGDEAVRVARVLERLERIVFTKDIEVVAELMWHMRSWRGFRRGTRRTRRRTVCTIG